MKIKVIWWIHSAHHFFGSFHLKDILSLGTPQSKPRWCHRYFFVINKVRKVNWNMCSSNRYIFKVAAILIVYKQAARRRYLQLSPIRHANVLSGRAFTWFCRALHGPFCSWTGRQFANGRFFSRIFVKHFGKRKKIDAAAIFRCGCWWIGLMKKTNSFLFSFLYCKRLDHNHASTHLALLMKLYSSYIFHDDHVSEK